MNEGTKGIDWTAAVGELEARLASSVAGAVASAVAAVRAELADRDQSAEVGELCGALAKARPGFGRVVKGQEATLKGTAKSGKSYDYSYRYASLDQAIEATAAALAEQGLVVMQSFDSQEEGAITVLTALYHASGQFLRTRLRMTCGADPQSIGSAITYARRYAYLAILNLAPADDDDGERAQRSATQRRAALPSQEAAARVAAAAGEGDPEAAWGAAARAVRDFAGSGDFHPEKVERILSAARGHGWTDQQAREAIRSHLGVEIQALPWKAFDAVLAVFDTVPGPETGERPDAADMTWQQVWSSVSREAVSRKDAEPAGGEYVESFLLPEIERISGWPRASIQRVLAEELGLTAEELPRFDNRGRVFGTAWVAKALKRFDHAEMMAWYEEREESEGEPAEAEETEAAPASEAPAVGRPLAEILEPLSGADDGFPGKDAEAGWSRIATALAQLRKHHPDAAAARVSPDNKMRCYRRPENGGRSSEEAARLVAGKLGLETFDALPDILAPAVLALLAAFPAGTPAPAPRPASKPAGMPKGWREMKVPELNNVVRALVAQGKLGEEDVAQSGARGPTRDDLVKAVEIAIERHGIPEEVTT